MNGSNGTQKEQVGGLVIATATPKKTKDDTAARQSGRRGRKPARYTSP